MMNGKNVKLEVKDLTIGYNDRIVLQNLNFQKKNFLSVVSLAVLLIARYKSNPPNKTKTTNG